MAKSFRLSDADYELQTARQIAAAQRKLAKASTIALRGARSFKAEISTRHLRRDEAAS